MGEKTREEEDKEFFKNAKIVEWNSSWVIPLRYVRSFCVGLFHPHTNLIQFRKLE